MWAKAPPPIDVGHQNYRSIQMLGHLHVGQVTVLEMDLNRAARPLTDQKVILLPQASEALLKPPASPGQKSFRKY